MDSSSYIVSIRYSSLVIFEDSLFISNGIANALSGGAGGTGFATLRRCWAGNSGEADAISLGYDSTVYETVLTDDSTGTVFPYDIDEFADYESKDFRWKADSVINNFSGPTIGFGAFDALPAWKVLNTLEYYDTLTSIYENNLNKYEDSTVLSIECAGQTSEPDLVWSGDGYNNTRIRVTAAQGFEDTGNLSDNVAQLTIGNLTIGPRVVWSGVRVVGGVLQSQQNGELSYRNMIVDASGQTRGFYLRQNPTEPQSLNNVIIYNASQDAQYINNVSNNTYVQNTTIVDAGRFGALRASYNDTLIVGSGNDDYFSSFQSQSNAWAEDSTGTNQITEADYKDVFVDYDANDFRLKADSSPALASAGAFIEGAAFTSIYPTINFRGTPNGFTTTPMVLVGNDLWECTVTFAGAPDDRFKFDVAGDWVTEWGDDNQDGIAEFNQSDIPFDGGAGNFIVQFNTISQQYTISVDDNVATEIEGNLDVALNEIEFTGEGSLGTSLLGNLDKELNSLIVQLSGNLGVEVRGTFDKLLDEITFDAAGQLGQPLTGALDIPLEPITFESLGNLGVNISGNLDAFLAAQTSEHLGKLGTDLEGNLDTQLSNNSSEIVGQIGQELVGNLSTNLAPLSVNIVGELGGGLIGALTVTLDEISPEILGEMGQDLLGNLAVDLSEIGFTGTGQLGANIDGNLEYTLESVAFTGEGVLGANLEGTLNAILSPVTFTGEGALPVPITGNLNVSLDELSSTMFGEVNAEISILDVKLEPITFTGYGEIGKAFNSLNFKSSLGIHNLNFRGKL